MAPRMKRQFSHLTLDDRRKIERWRHMRLSPDEMTRRLGRHRASICRERRRNHHHDVETPRLRGYSGVLAQRFCDVRRHKKRKMVAYRACLWPPRSSGGWTQSRSRAGWLMKAACRGSAKSRLIATSTPIRAARRSSSATCPRAGAGGTGIVCASDRQRDLQIKSVSCSGQMRSPIAASSGIGKLILCCFVRNAARPM